MIFSTGHARTHKYIQFSAGEPHVDIGPYRIPEMPFDIVVTKPTMDQLFEAFLLADAIRNVYGQSSEIVLHLAYIPFGRQDRVTSTGTAFSLRVFADILNLQGFAEVRIKDPHSTVAPALIKNCVVEDVVADIQAFINAHGLGDCALVAPDLGAEKRVGEIAKKLGGRRVVQALKKRDPASGQITGYRVIDPVAINEQLLVVDDICDGGATFVALSNAFPEPVRLSLFVTHGIFARGLNILTAAGYRHVGWANWIGQGPEPDQQS